MALLTPLPSCMTEAWDGYEVDIITDTIPFKGYHPKEGEEITVEAWDYQNEEWKPVASAVAEEPVELDDDVVLYRWKTEAELDEIGDYNRAIFWAETGLCKGQKAQVRAVEADSGRRLVSSRENGEECALANPSLDKWVQNCRAENSPVIEIFTKDAAPLPEVDVDMHLLNPSGGCGIMYIHAAGFHTAFEGAEVLAKVSANAPGVDPVWYECSPLDTYWTGAFMTQCEPPDEWPYNDPQWMADNQDKITVEYRVGFECNGGSIRYSSTGWLPIYPQETYCGDGEDPGKEPPPPPESGTEWSYTCNCVTVHCTDMNRDNVCDDPKEAPYEYFDIHTSTCFGTSSGSLPAGIGLMCGSAANWAQIMYGLQNTECTLDWSPAPSEEGSCTGPYGRLQDPSATLL